MKRIQFLQFLEIMYLNLVFSYGDYEAETKGLELIKSTGCIYTCFNSKGKNI